MVPIGDVLAEHDGVGAGDELSCVDFCEKRVGGRTVRAAFRGEELDEHWLRLIWWRGSGRRMSELLRGR